MTVLRPAQYSKQQSYTRAMACSDQGEMLLRNLTKVEITLCALLGLVLVIGVISALAGIPGVPSAAILLVVGLSSLLLIKFGARLCYISSKSKLSASKLNAIEGSVGSLHKELQKTSTELLNLQQRSLLQTEQIATEIKHLDRTNREEFRSLQESVVTLSKDSSNVVAQASKSLTTDLKDLRKQVGEISAFLEATSDRSAELQKILENKLSQNEVTLVRAIDSGIDRSESAIRRNGNELKLLVDSRGKDLLTKIDGLASSVEDAQNTVGQATDQLKTELDVKLASIADELRRLPSLIQNLDTSEQVRNLVDTLDLLVKSTKADKSSILESIDNSVLGESSAEKMAAVVAREGLQTRRQLRRHITDTVRDSTRQVEAIAKLQPRLRNVHPLIPSTGGFALDAQALLHLIDVLERERPSVIVEFGGGTSTIWMAYICQKYNTRIISIDHLEEYLEVTKTEVARHGFSDMVECRLAPLEPLMIDGNEYSWYSVSALSDLDNIDLVFIDGPPESTGPNARRPAMHVMIEKLNPDSVVILDDTHRESEQATVREWLSSYSSFKIVDEHISRLSVLESKG